jgi:hypothetical protein
MYHHPKMKRSSVMIVGLVIIFTLYSFMSSSSKMDDRLRSDLRQRVDQMRQKMRTAEEQPFFSHVRLFYYYSSSKPPRSLKPL